MTEADQHSTALTSQAARDDRSRAVEVLVALTDQNQQRLFAFLVVMLGDRASAADCLQETLLRAFENLVRGRPVNVQWLYKVARHRAVDELRLRQRVQLAANPIEPATPDEPDLSADSWSVRRALQQLSADDREVLYLSEVDGFTSVEIGEMLGVRPGTVRMRLYRAHTRFRQAYRGEE